MGLLRMNPGEIGPTMAGQTDLSPQSPKTAGVSLYLMEELGDARLRCDQLTRYIAEAVKLINQSKHKDHFFEVAGHLLQGIPTTAFKLQKSLQAVALAADRMDYEELKLELRPEKVEELENVLKEVRIRQVQHRSESPMTPKQVATKLRTLAKVAREEGYLPITEIAALVGRLDQSRVASSSQLSVAETFDRIATSLETATVQPSRVQLATLLSRVAMESEFAEWLRASSQHQFSNAEEVKQKFKAENPSMSEADLEEVARQWEANKDVVRDKAAAFLTPKETLTLNFDEVRLLALKGLQAAKGERWKAALNSMYFLVDTIGTILVNMGSMDTVKVEALKREIRELLPKAEDSVSSMSVAPVVTASADKLERLVSNIEVEVKGMRHALDTYNKDPGKYAPQLDNLKSSGGSIATSLRMLDRILPAMMKTASDKEPVIQSALVRAANLLQKVAASTLWMYTDDEGKDFYLATKRRGTLRSPYTGKAFTADAQRATMGDVGKELKEDEVKVKGSLWKYVDGDGNEFYLPERLTTTLRSPTTGKSFKPKAERFTLSEVGKSLREKEAFDEGPTLSRYEEGKPADPTENMSQEDAEEWKANTEEYGDNFKSAAKGDPYWMTAKYPGKAKDGTAIRKGDKVFYYPLTKVMLVGRDAEKASREFDAEADDERNFKASEDILAWKV